MDQKRQVNFTFRQGGRVLHLLTDNEADRAVQTIVLLTIQTVYINQTAQKLSQNNGKAMSNFQC